MKMTKEIFTQFAVPKIFILSFFLFSFVISDNINEKTIIQSMDVSQTSHVIFKTMDEVNVEYWDKDYISVQTNIRADKIRPQMMAHFIQLDVFNLDVHQGNDTMMISTFGQEKLVFMNGVEVQWEVDYRIFTPSHVIIETKRNANDDMLIVFVSER